MNWWKNYVQQNKLRITGKGYTNDIKWQITMHVVIIFIYWTGIKYMAINILCRLLLFILHTDSLGCSAASLKFIEDPLSNCDTPLSNLTASLFQQIYSFHSVTVSKKGKSVKNWWRLLFWLELCYKRYFELHALLGWEWESPGTQKRSWAIKGVDPRKLDEQKTTKK